MALTTEQQVRLKIQDLPTVADVTVAGDGRAVIFELNQRNITSGTAFVPGAGGWSATGATFNATGFVTLGTAVSAGSALRLRYVYSTFGDDEIDDMLAQGGNVNGAAIQAVQALMFDGLRRAAWRAADGSTYDDTRAMQLLKDLYAALKEEEHEASSAESGFESWAVNQADY